LRELGDEDEVLDLENIDKPFSDSETCVRLALQGGGYDVFLFQALFDPTSERSVDQNYMAFLIAVAKLMADLSIETGIARLITWDLYSGQLRGFMEVFRLICWNR